MNGSSSVSRHIAVTGAAGHLGAILVRELLARGVRVKALVYGNTRSIDQLDVELMHVDIRDEHGLQQAFAGVDVVYHLAAKISITSDTRDLESVNVGGTRAVVNSCQAAHVRRLVHFSSVHALAGRPGDLPVDEHNPPADSDSDLPYDRSKARAEREVLAGVAAGLPAVIVNPTGVIGPYDYRPSNMGEALLAMYHRTIPSLVDGGFDWVDGRDVAVGAMAAAERGRVGERYLLGGHWASLAQLSAMIADATGAKTLRAVCPMPVARTAAPLVSLYSRLRGRPPLFTSQSLRILRGHRVVRSDKASRELGFTARPLAETIADTFAWFGEAGMLEPSR
jgi:dihydroflavonol-4-reductase